MNLRAIDLSGSPAVESEPASVCHRTNAPKVLFVNAGGGAYGSERSMITLLSTMSGFRAEVACPVDGPLAAILGTHEITLHGIEFNQHRFARRPDWHIRFYHRFRRILSKSRPDALVVNLDGNTSLVVLAALRSRIPVVRFSRFEFTPPRRWIDRFCWLKSAAVICPSDLVRSQVLIWSPREFHSKVHRWYDPLVSNVVSKRETEKLRRELDLNGARVIGFVGRLHVRKGIETLLRAMPAIRRRYPEVALLVIGGHDGSAPGIQYAARLVALAHELGISDAVRFLGYRKDAAALIAGCDLLALPSESESFGMVLAEAWLQGVPTVASDVGGCREITLASGGGMLAPVGDFQKFAGASLDLFSNPQRAARMGEAGRNWARENCDPSRYAEKFESLLKVLVAGDRRP